MSANQMAPAVSTFGGGGFVVVWGTSDPSQDGSSSAIKAQLFDASGSKVGMEFRVNEDASGYQFTASTTALDGGRFVVAWVTSGSEDGTDANIWLSGNQAFTFIGAAAFSRASRASFATRRRAGSPWCRGISTATALPTSRSS